VRLRIGAVTFLQLAMSCIPREDERLAGLVCMAAGFLGGAQHVKLTDYHDPAERAVAVSIFDARLGGMEQVLWWLSVTSRPGLLSGEGSPALEALVWTVKSWWGVQGVRSETTARMASALAASMTWTLELFGAGAGLRPGLRRVRERVAEIVRRR
jgi:hypothetical protein